jgi:hypothetical protein
MIENDISMLVLSKLVSSKCLLFLCLKNRAKRGATLPKGYILEKVVHLQNPTNPKPPHHAW